MRMSSTLRTGFGLTIVAFISTAVVLGDYGERQVITHLLSQYDVAARPGAVANRPLNVTFGLALTQIIDVDERNQILTTNCWLNQIWNDAGLTWNPADFDNVSVVRIPQELLWKPDIVLYNNADSVYRDSILSTNLIVTSRGDVTWLSSAIFKSSCAINVEYFPFDEQNCTMKFASWTYDGLQVDLRNQSDKADLSNYVSNGEWNLQELIAERNEVFYSCCSAPYPDITYRIRLRRRPLFYVFNLVLPCVLITGIALLSFYVPADSGEKVTLGITTLLSMTVFLMVIGESMPPTSEKLPLIGLYYGVTISLVSFATGLSVVTLNIHHRGSGAHEPPYLLKHVVFNFIAPLICMPVSTGVYGESSVPSTDRISASHLEMQPNVCPPKFCMIHGQWSDPDSPGPHSSSCPYHWTRINRNSHRASNPPGNINCFTVVSAEVEHHIMHVLTEILHTTKRSLERIRERERRDVIRSEWQLLALVIDRFLLWIFTVSTLGATFGILYMSPYTKLFSI